MVTDLPLKKRNFSKQKGNDRRSYLGTLARKKVHNKQNISKYNRFPFPIEFSKSCLIVKAKNTTSSCGSKCM